MQDTTYLTISKNQPYTPFPSKKTYDRVFSLSNGAFEEVNTTKAKEEFFNTIYDTKINKVTTFIKVKPLYNNYEIDPIVLALSVDPLANKAPGWSPYAAMANSPISVNDPDGAFPIYFMIRRYESSRIFGTPFISKGDNRQTSANVNSTARIHHLIGIETNTEKSNNPVFYNRARSSESTQYTPWYGKETSKPSSSAAGNVLYNDDKVSTSNFNFSNSAMEPIASKLCESCTPAIDTKGVIGVNDFKDKGEVQIFGSVSGDSFPDAEGFIYDANGNGVSLGDYQHSKYGSPSKDLWGEGGTNLLTFDITVKVDKDGNFQSASFMKDGKSTSLKIYTPKETNFKSPEEKK